MPKQPRHDCQGIATPVLTQLLSPPISSTANPEDESRPGAKLYRCRFVAQDPGVYAWGPDPQTALNIASNFIQGNSVCTVEWPE